MSEPAESRSVDAKTEEFVPRGAAAFMVVMIVVYGAMWLFFYFLMVGRA